MKRGCAISQHAFRDALIAFTSTIRECTSIAAITWYQSTAPNCSRRRRARAGSACTGEARRPLVSSLKQTAALTVESARQKLSLWGLTSEQIRRIETERTPSDHLTIYAPESGVVVKRHIGQGAYVQTGERIYTTADLSHLWLKLEVYESDLPWIQYGQSVEFRAEALPGERFAGRISFIDPLLDEKTRTVGVRVNVDNADGRLKPGMLVRAVVRSQTAANGNVANASLVGKWISPMHPEIVKEQAGLCDVCGMALVRTDSLGYVDQSTDSLQAPLLLPASAPLLTGKRAIVYVAMSGKAGHYEGREVELGPRAGDYYIVRLVCARESASS